MKKITFFILLAMCAGGCWTVYQTDYPKVELSRVAQGENVFVQLSGFESMITSYQAVYSYETVWRPRYAYHRGYEHHYYGHAAETYSTTTYVPQTNPTTHFVERAREQLEDSGFIVATTNAKFRIDVKFSGPVVTRDDNIAKVMWLLCSALSADYSAQAWRANLRIYDVASGKMVFHQTYREKYAAAVWGLVPIFSPSCAGEISDNFGHMWCLSALTDRTLADATAFILSQKK